MKPEFPTNGLNSAVSCKISSKEGCSVSDSKTNNDTLDEFSTKINHFFEIHNSFLYEDVHENASDLKKYLLIDPASGVKINGEFSHEDEAVEDEKSESQKLYSSGKTYSRADAKGSPDLLPEDGNITIQSAKKSLGNRHLSPFEIVKIPAIPDSFQLPISNETRNMVTFDAFSSENNIMDIKFPTFNSSSLPQDLTKAQRSVRLNKKSNLKKIIKKSTDEKLTVPYKSKECLSPKDVISRDVAEKSKLENAIPVHRNLEMNSSLGDYCDLSENEEQKYQREIQPVYDPQYNPRVILEDIFKMQHNNENEAYVEKAQAYVEKEVFKLSSKSRKKLQPEEKTMRKKNVGKTSKKVLNSGKNFKKNKALSSEAKNNLNETNDSVKAKDKTFTPDQNSFSNQSKLSIKSTNIAEENLSKKRKLRICNNSVKEVAEEVSLKKKIASRKKSFPQNISRIETKFDKKNTPKNKAALEKGDILNENNVEVTDLPVKEVAEEVSLKKKIASRKKSFPQNISRIETKFDKKNTPKNKAALEKGDILNENNVEVTDLPGNEIGSDLINNKITANKNLNTKIKAKKSASKKKVVLENEDNLDHNGIIDDAALHVKESRNNLCKYDVVATDKIFNTKIEIKKSTRKKKNSLENNEDILNKNKIVENTNLTINEIGKDLMKNKIVAADKHLNTKIKVNRKNTTKKRNALEKEGILNKNNITENVNLPVNEIGTDFIKSKTLADNQNQKSKSMQLQTITPVSQNSSVKNILNSLNKNTTLSGTPQRNSNLLELFNKVIVSGSSETFSTSNNSFAKLFKQHSSCSSKFTAIHKINKEFNQKQDEEQLLQPNSSKESNINLANLKSFKAAEEKSVKITPVGKKRSNEDNTEVTPLKKKKQNQDPVKRNSEKSLNGEVSSNEDSDEHYNDKITKTTKKQLVQSIVSKPSRRSSKRNQKLDGESNVTSDLCNQEKRKSVQKNVEDVKSLAKSYSSCNPASFVQASSKRNSRAKNSTKIESVDAQSSHKTKGKADSLLSTESESMYSDEKFDACSFIKVIEVKSLANLNEKKNTNVRMRKSNSFVSDSFSEDSKAMENSEKQLPVSNSGQNNRRKNKHLHLTLHENSCAIQSEENTSIDLNSADSSTRTKRKRRSTTVHPDFCYEVKTQRIKKEDKSFSDHKNGIESPIVKKSPSKLMRCKETDFINEMSNADTTQEDANEHVQICNDGEQVCNLNSNGVPMSSLNSEQFKDFLSSYTLYPLNTPQCHILYNPHLNSSLLAIPIQSPLNSNLPALMQSITNDNMSGTSFQAQSYPLQSFSISPFISSTQSPVLSTRVPKQSSSLVNSHRATSVVSDQNVPSLQQNTINKNILSKQQPQTILSAVYSKNASVTSSKEISCNPYSNNFVNNVHSVRISPSKAAWSVEALQAPSILQKSKSELCINWESILRRSFELKDIGFIDKLSKNTYGRKLDQFTVREFCSNPVVVQELSKQLKLIRNDIDPQRIDYYFPDSILDEPFTQVLRDVVHFFLRHMPEETLQLSGGMLKANVYTAIYSTFSFQLSMLFSELVPVFVNELTSDKMAGVLCLVAIVYIFYNCKKKIEM